MDRVKSKRYRLRDSERSGFTYKEIELIRDEGSLVGSDEFDSPPPSNIPLGGAGDRSTSEYYRASTSTVPDASHDFTTQYITTANQIAFVKGDDASGTLNPNFGWLYISGSNSSVTVSTNPQITSGSQNDKIAIQCVGSNVILQDGNGLDLRTSIVNMDSGYILNLFYSATDSLWHETSRSHQTRNLGEL